MNIYRDKCDNYIQRRMYRCLFCGDYVINLPQHVALDHKKTMSAYRVETKNIDPRFTSVRRKNLWE
jgi:hypothetical protein